MVEQAALRRPRPFLHAPLTEAQEAQLLGELWYVNAHSDAAPAGEIRGQLPMVPEPQTWITMGMGPGLVAYALHRRRR